MEQNVRRCWLMKAEPDSRLVKGKDVKFSVDDFESVGSTPWEGVRNYEARNLMKEMVLGDKILFYHSNCKDPGITGFAEVSKEAYPDYTAWDSGHPYFDEKSDRNSPKWFMVDVKFVSRARNFIPLSLLRYLAELPCAKPPEALGYMGETGINTIKAMPLITRSRLSVQRVPEECWDIIEMMAEQGGWDSIPFGKKKGKAYRERRTTAGHNSAERLAGQHDEGRDAVQPMEETAHMTRQSNAKRGRKRKVSTSTSPEDGAHSLLPRHKSLRTMKN